MVVGSPPMGPFYELGLSHIEIKDVNGLLLERRNISMTTGQEENEIGPRQALNQGTPGQIYSIKKKLFHKEEDFPPLDRASSTLLRHIRVVQQKDSGFCDQGDTNLISVT